MTAQVSDDDDEENGVNLAQFDTNLIEIPSDSPRNGQPAVPERTKAVSGIQYKADGALSNIELHTASLYTLFIRLYIILFILFIYLYI